MLNLKGFGWPHLVIQAGATAASVGGQFCIQKELPPSIKNCVGQNTVE